MSFSRRAGLRVGDVLVAVEGESVTSSTALQKRMIADAIGRRVEITDGAT